MINSYFNFLVGMNVIVLVIVGVVPSLCYDCRSDVIVGKWMAGQDADQEVSVLKKGLCLGGKFSHLHFSWKLEHSSDSF
jgi:hypothetical protein